MMEQVFARIARFGRDMTIMDDGGNSVTCKGFLQPVDTLDTEGIDLFQGPGMVSGVKYLLLLGPEAVDPGRRAEHLICQGKEYEVLGLRDIWCGETLTHWEGVARKKGGCL